MSEQSKQIKGLKFKREKEATNGKVYEVVVNPGALFQFLKENPDVIESYKDTKFVRVAFIPTQYGHMAVHNKYEEKQDSPQPSTANLGNDALPF